MRSGTGIIAIVAVQLALLALGVTLLLSDAATVAGVVIIVITLLTIPALAVINRMTQPGEEGGLTGLGDAGELIAGHELHEAAPTPHERIAQLDELHAEGRIGDAEYEAERNRLLGELE